MRSKLAAVLVLSACGSGGSAGSADGPRRVDAAGAPADAPRADAPAPDAAAMALRPVLPCADPMAAVYAAPAQGTEPLGTILACAHDRAISAAALADAASRLRYSGRALSSGTDVYRIAYRTDRGPGGRGVGTALVLVPDRPRASGPQPLVVAGHGTVGVAKRCAPSRGELAAAGDFLDDARGVTVPLAGDGWLVVAPDYGGYSTDWPPGFLVADDEGRGVLDATRAAAQLFGPALSGKVALVGHSQGGHAVLSAQSLARAHGHYGELAAVVAFTPLWISAANFAAIASDVSGVTPAGAPYLFGYGLQYFWTHAERYEGRAAAEAIFLPRAVAGVRAFVEEGCLLDEETLIPALGAMPSDVFDPTFGDDVAGCAVAPDSSCGSAVAMRWQTRFLADRPHLDPQGAPVMLLFGGGDTTITPPRAQCAIDRVTADLAAAGATATMRVCGDPLAIHSGIGDPAGLGATRRMMKPALEWLDEKLLGRGAATPCDPRFVPAGMPDPVCTTPPPND